MYKILSLKLKKNKIINNIWMFNRFLYSKNIQQLTVYFLRKNNTFIKSKYARTRQWSKVIVYFGYCMNLMSVVILYMYCFKLIFIWSYLWWLGFAFCALFVFKSFKLNCKYFYWNMFN